MLVWILVDGEAACHGPFADILAIGRYLKEAALPEPLTALQVANGDPRPVAVVVHDALTARGLRAMEKR